MRHDCINLVEPTDMSAEQRCEYCPGTKYVSIWECDVKGLCTPFAVGDLVKGDGLTNCRLCESYESNGLYCDMVEGGNHTYRCSKCGYTVVTSYPNRIENRCPGRP